MISRVALVMLASGCDWAFQVNHYDHADAALLPPGPELVTGHIVERYATNGTGASPIALEHTFAATEITFTAKLPDGSDPQFAYNETDGTFSFHRTTADQPYSLIVSTNTAYTEYQHDVAQLDLAVLIAGRIDAAPLTQSDLTFGYIDQNTGTVNGITTATIVSTGQWSQTDSGMYGPAVIFDWRTVNPVGGTAIGLLDQTQGDRVFVIGTSAAMGYVAITLATSAQITQHANQGTVLPTPVSVSPNACIRFTSNSLDERNRIMAAQPRTYLSTPLEADWMVLALPTAKVGQAGALGLATLGYAPPRNIMQTTQFFDPYNNHEHWVEAGAIAYVQYSLASAMTPLQLANTTRRYQPITTAPPATCTQAMTPVLTTVALPRAISLDGTALTSDDLPIHLDPLKDVPVAWDLAAPAPVDETRVSLIELVSVNNTVEPMGLQSIEVVHGAAVFDRAHFQVGHTYMLLLQSSLNYPNALTGDFNTLRTDYYERSEVFSHSFVVMP